MSLPSEQPNQARAWPAAARRIIAVVAAVVLAVAVCGIGRWQPAHSMAADGPVRDPELEGGIAWLNTAGPVRLSDLRGKIVLLDFWTLCCINCIHTIPDLKKLEEKYPNELVVIGVHSPKFDNEKDTESIRKAILRYEVTHPVVNDADRKLWEAYECE